MRKLLIILEANVQYVLEDLNIKTYSLYRKDVIGRLYSSSLLDVFPFTPISSVSKMSVAPPNQQ